MRKPRTIFRVLPWVLLVGLMGHVRESVALGQPRYVQFSASAHGFALINAGRAATLVIDSGDAAGVAIAAGNLRADITRVSGLDAPLSSTGVSPGATIVLIGTIGHNRLIDQLIADKKLDVSPITGRWESFLTQVIASPFPGTERALVICGSDRRGTIFGIYDLSEQMGVSPWYYWADVSTQHHDTVYVRAGRYIQGEPSVKYRGIFINDEYPDLTRWVQEKYGAAPGYPASANYGHEFYARVFELLLRLKGNYLWPAMWNNAFNEDDPENARLADEYGIVMGTSHQEPMLRAQQEWDRRYLQEYGHWNYASHPQLLENFWRDGIRRNKDYESLITIGLRGANDTPMAEGGPEANKSLLEHIVDVQRGILAEELNADVTRVPQVWCLYKEVMDYYDAGMRVPDDVTLLWAEDNWGNIRRLPTAGERQRAGGAGIYYHFDYHGEPRSYQWINSNPIAKVWDQMSLAKQYGADRIWIVNVGHLKGYELPTEYFMHLAWNSNRWRNDNISEFTRLWAEREFGRAHGAQIADILGKYSKYNGRRKPELLDANTYSLVNYDEFEKVVADFNAIAARAEKISARLSPSQRAAFYELVLFPVKASAQLNEMYLAAARNALYARQGRASTNDMAMRVRSLFAAETGLMDYFNRSFLAGRWDHFMDQPVIGYTGWRDPPQNTLGAITLTDIQPLPGAVMGVAVEGSVAAVTGGQALMPQFDVFTQQRHYVDIFNKGRAAFEFTAVSDRPWIVVDVAKARVGEDRRIWIGIDWSRAPPGIASGMVTLSGAGNRVELPISAFNPPQIRPRSVHGFVESGGVVSIEPEHFTRRKDAGSNRWVTIEDYGRTLSGMRSEGLTDAPRAVPGKNSPSLEYRVYLFSTGSFDITTITAPTLNFLAGRGLQFALSVDDQPCQTVTVVGANSRAADFHEQWAQSVTDNARYAHATLEFATPGYHTLKFWMLDPGVVLQKIVINAGGLKASYLGPPESFHVLERTAGGPEGPPR
ncbi:MAG TPA: glycosyl hydrolase 115 family protein [Steroidobacteraceae bacterium]